MVASGDVINRCIICHRLQEYFIPLLLLAKLDVLMGRWVDGIKHVGLVLNVAPDTRELLLAVPNNSCAI